MLMFLMWHIAYALEFLFWTDVVMEVLLWSCGWISAAVLRGLWEQILL